MASSAQSNIYIGIFQYRLVGNYHQNFAIDMLLTASGVLYLPSLQYITAVRVFGLPVIAALTCTWYK